MRIVHDEALCDANGFCVAHAPELFRLLDDDTLEVIDPSPPTQLHERAREAFLVCPKRALSEQ